MAAKPAREITQADRLAISLYTPELAPGHWTTIGDFAIEVMLDYLPHTPAKLSTMLRHWVAYVDWTHFVADVPLDRERILDPDVIAYYIATGATELAPSSRTSRRAFLLRMCDFLLPDMRRTIRMQPIAKEPANQPYTPAEIERLRAWATSRATAYQRHSAWCIIAYGLGAGLTASELTGLRREDVTLTDDGTVRVEVREAKRNQPRSVPVMADFADEVLALAESVEPGSYVFRSLQTSRTGADVGAWASRLGTAGGLNPNLSRMRSTWIVRQLNAGVPMLSLMAAAGFVVATAFDRYLPYARPVAWEELVEDFRRNSNEYRRTSPTIQAKRKASARRAYALAPEKFRAAKKQWRTANPDKVREQNRRYVETHRETVNAKQRRWNEANAEGRRAYREANRDRIAENKRRYRQDNPELVREQERASRDRNAEAAKARSRAYYVANRGRLTAAARRRRDADPEAARQRARDYYAANRAEIRQKAKEAYRRRQLFKGIVT